jgi:hypothetical protein
MLQTSEEQFLGSRDDLAVVLLDATEETRSALVRSRIARR